MHNAVFHREDVVGIRVQASAFQERLELTEVLAVEENDGWAVGRNIFGLRAGPYPADAEKHNDAADLQISRANTHGDGVP